MPDYKMYNLTLTTLTPLHIGTGRDLLLDYDYDVAGGKTWVINQSALLDAQNVDDPKVAAQLAQTPPAELLEDKDFVEGNPFFRYVLRGKPHSEKEGAVIQEQFKDVYDQPYLPGSSVKGALRTALGWHAWKALNLDPEADQLKDNPKFAASNYEHTIFGRDPNNDTLRALQVSDSAPLKPDCLFLMNVRVISPATTRKAASDIPVELEGIRVDTTFHASLKLDLALFSDWAKKYGLRLGGKEWLTDIPKIANAHAMEQVKSEAKWFKTIPGAASVLEFYDTLQKSNLGSGTFFLRLGWGTGWENKTFGSRLQADEEFMAYIVTHYRMRKGPGGKGGKFPSSRRASVHFEKTAQGSARDTLAKPPGWLLVEMTERSTDV